jgi:butyrate kinase
MKKKVILAINPGSTSTKIAIFEEKYISFIKNIKHTSEELAPFKTIADQYEFRKNIILKELSDAGLCIDCIDAVVGRGGFLKPLKSGVYEVNELMKEHLRIGYQGQHASNLGGLIADDIAKSIPNARAFIADPVVVDELDEVARVTGHPEFKRKSIFHALNQKAIARTFALAIGRPYEELNLIVAHLGGGISVGAHRQGKVVDVNQALDGSGPFSPERSGTLPVGDLVRLCYSGKYSQEEIMKMIVGKGGLVAHLGTNNAQEMEQRANSGDEHARLIEEAMAYQVAKEIGAMGTVLKGQIDAILLTGGIAYNKEFVNMVTQMVAHIARVRVYPGEDEMKALANNGLMVLNGELEVMNYE